MDQKKIPPIPLILYSQESHSYILTPEAQTLFSSIPSNHQIAILTILGPYRTGKSLLLNRVLLSRSQGFQVGNTVNSCTKGLWLYAVSGHDFLKGLPPGETSGINDESTVLIIDTEGFGSVNVTQTHDNRIFLMALMLSSLVIYNSVGTIDENALNQLALITSLSNEIQSKLDAPITMPYFIWILRDFMLKLEDKNGYTITSKDYLETSLDLQKGVSDIAEKKNKVRRMFNHYFPDRDCVTMSRPTETEEELGRLNELEDHRIRKEFLEQLQALKVKILKKCCPKSIIIDSKTKVTKSIIGGTMIMSLCNSFLEVINEGKICKIESIWSMVSSNEAQKSLQRSLEAFGHIREKYLKDMKEIGKETLREFRKNVRKDILANYMDKIKHLEMNNQEPLLRSLMEGIAEKLSKFEKENKANWIQKYEAFMEREQEKFEEKALDHDNYFDFREDLQKLEAKFEKEMQGGLKRKQFFTQISLKLWIKYIESYTRKHKKLESQKLESIELLKLMKEKKSSDNVKTKTETEAEKKELAKLFELLQTQLQESRQVQDQILTSIKDQKEQKDRETSQNQSFLIPQPSQPLILDSPIDKTPEPSIMDEKVMETNRYLSMALEKTEDLLKKQETVLKAQEKKLEKYREYKKFLSLASSIECHQCHGSIKPLEFLSHATTCKVIQKPVMESPEINKTYDFHSSALYQPNESYSTNLTSNFHQRATMSPMDSHTAEQQHRTTISLLPSYDHSSSTLHYTHHIATQMKKDHNLTIDVNDEREREEHRKAKSFLPETSGYVYEEFDDNNDNIYSMPRPLFSGGVMRKDFLKDENLKREEDQRDLNLPFMRTGINYWESPLSDVMGTKKTQFSVGEEKFKEFNLTLIPEGEMKTMNYVKKKSKGSSKGSNGGITQENEEQGIKGLMKGQKPGAFLDRRNSWNFNMKSGEFNKKAYE